jgi:hypothetical protein
VVLTDLSDANGEGDFITAWDWDVSGPATLLAPWAPQTTTFDYYVCAGADMVPTPPAPAPDPAGFDVTFYSSSNSSTVYTPAPVYNFGSVSKWGGRTYYYNGVEGAPGLMGARVDIQNLLGFDITILNLTVQVTAASPATANDHNSSHIMIDTLDQYRVTDGNYDECDYSNGSILVKRMPDMHPSGNVLDRGGFKHRDPTSYPDYPLGLLHEDNNVSGGDATAYGHVAPIALANGGTYFDYFGPVVRSDKVISGAQMDATYTFVLTWVATDGPTLEFHCDAEGDVTVTLTVWDDEGLTAEVTKIVPQREAPTAEVDLWTNEIRFCGQITDKLGKGFAVPADALSPDVNVTFLALVTWGGAPLAHRLVGFEIVDPQSNNIVTRTAETNKSGVAVIWWRVPLMNPPEQIFGVWNATVSVKIQDTKVYDYMPFKVGYVITITGKWEDKAEYDIGNPDGSATDGDYIEVTVELKNIMMITKEVYLAVTIYDDCDVPILKLQDSGLIDPEFPWCSSYFMNVTLVGRIPHWAYVGVGKVYANVYTAPPFECGTPYSPEVSNVISLVWSGELLCHD